LVKFYWIGGCNRRAQEKEEKNLRERGLTALERARAREKERERERERERKDTSSGAVVFISV
jgi:hypothetical protein